ncbi:Bifunctional transaldolase/phosoglucose isomerase [Candidatus Sulfopaludibacter sp. SbA4]|nr:Bifunctional transaldolase/phosoglucose isomerase [Candidatus Sulfopaludibacter sp. SbA4]
MTTQASIAVNPLRALAQYGQSVWLDYIRRSLITSGELDRLIREDGLRGVTSNPAIFEKAIAGSTDYQDILEDPASRSLDAKQIYERIAVRDIQDAARILNSVYESTNTRDGYVSLEVSPTLAHDTAGTLAEARRLWSWVSRPNVMIKVPGTPEGIPAIRQLISEGINVNVTLLFSQAVYEQVAEAYIAGLEARAAAGHDISRVASVASFFVSRIDSVIDAHPAAKQAGIAGKVAIANARLTYHCYNQIVGSARWTALAAKGAQTQRLLWASTSTKNPSYRDVMYVEELIGPDTVDTIPPATLNAFRDHGNSRPSLVEDLESAQDTMETLAKIGISMKEVTGKLTEDGVQQFATAFEALLQATGKASAKINRQTAKLPAPLAAAVQTALADWKAPDRTGGIDKARRLWRGDASLWSGEDEAKWVGWLGIVDDQIAHIQHLKDIAAEVRSAGFKHALLLGMGGSSLCPEVMRMTYGTVPGFPELHVLDSTDPAQIRAIEEKIDLASTLFIVSSKSGGTLEPNIFKQYFFERSGRASDRFIAITDPGSKMQHVAETDHFRHIFFGLPSIGGRYSALSDFGMVPAAVMGVDVPRFLELTSEMVHACAPTVPVEDNPGVQLGAILGVLGNLGRDKVTLISSPGIHDLGAWLEQLIAESTGKIGNEGNRKGLIPVDREALGSPEVYGNDRVFAYLRLESAPDAAQDKAVDALESAGQPVVRISVGDVYNLGEEFFRWEIATAVAGSILGINPFNQPDVEASKIATRKLTEQYEQTGHLPAEAPILEAGGIQLFADAKNAADLRSLAGADQTPAGYLKAHLGRLAAGDYFALLGYIQMNEAHESVLQTIRHAVRDTRHVATCLGFGPRFLHSTGQAYKGGPDSGVFLQITCDDAADLPVPGQKYTFGVVKAAQARGDFQVLAERGRRALRVHLGPDVNAGLQQLASLVKGAL